MSGPSLDEQICYADTEEMATMKTVRKLRELADYVEEDARPVRKDIEPERPEFENREHVAELLRLKADKIEASLGVIENETQSQNFKQLLKAIQWTRSGDYGTASIQEAWDDYAEEITIKVER